ncbi:MAG: glycosyltransferase family 2 protein [Bacteroidales bacterium]|nr:glycosyltransferase family 2 protein [Bacteroidales bacterium]MCF8455595.1 glycosyltransferase family 2 protein [Bacteroidales bacterium]
MTEKREYPLVSIISVNYNQSQVTLEMLDSLRKISYPNFEIIIVDNGSPSDKPENIKEKYPEVNLIISKKNLGFAGGNNLGVKEAKGKYVLFLNNDTEPEPDFLEPLVDILEKREDVVMASPKLIFYFSEGKNMVQYAGAKAINPYTGRGYNIGYKQIDKGQFSESQETDLGHGAALLVRMDTMLKFGLMPDIFFLYYEEHDWCAMLRQKGMKVWYVAESVVYHKESISIGKNSPLKAYHMARNRVLYLRRRTSWSVFTVCMLYFSFVATPKIMLTYLMKGEFDLFKAFNKGIFWNFTHYKGVHKNPKLIERDGYYELKDTYHQF